MGRSIVPNDPPVTGSTFVKTVTRVRGVFYSYGNKVFPLLEAIQMYKGVDAIAWAFVSIVL